MLKKNKLEHCVVLWKTVVGHVELLHIDFFLSSKFTFFLSSEYAMKLVFPINMNLPIDNSLIFRKKIT